MGDILIFVSCGQKTPEETSLGKKVKDLIDSKPGYSAYFAETVHDLDSLNDAIYEALARCSGAIVFLHDRGSFTDKNGNLSQRSSIWINQELGILSFRQYYESCKIPILAFKEENVNLEGAMTSMILNPLPMRSEDEMMEEVKNYLKKESFGEGGKDVFEEKWLSVTDDQRKLLTCLIDEGGSGVKEAAIRNRLVKDFSLQKNDASRIILDAKVRLTKIGFVQFTPNIYTGDEFSLHDSWKFMVRRKIREWNSAAKIK